MAVGQSCKNLSHSPQDLESEAWIWHSVTCAVSHWPKQGVKSSPDSRVRKLSPSLGGKTYIQREVGMVAFFAIYLLQYMVAQSRTCLKRLSSSSSSSRRNKMDLAVDGRFDV